MNRVQCLCVSSKVVNTCGAQDRNVTQRCEQRDEGSSGEMMTMKCLTYFSQRGATKTSASSGQHAKEQTMEATNSPSRTFASYISHHLIASSVTATSKT